MGAIGSSKLLVTFYQIMQYYIPEHGHLHSHNDVFFVTQASELEVLQAVLKWGEHELIRRMEDRGQYLLLGIYFEFDHYADCWYTYFIHTVQNPTS
jgi:hypothetical protein